jgi:hypothetical protein
VIVTINPVIMSTLLGCSDDDDGIVVTSEATGRNCHPGFGETWQILQRDEGLDFVLGR